MFLHRSLLTRELESYLLAEMSRRIVRSAKLLNEHLKR